MTAPQPSIPYRPALDGLRAVAVTGVVLFHACALTGYDGWFRGGNLGVSVFFTLSGYLIASLLLAGAASDSLSMRSFWGRRAIRLVPAAATTTAVVVACGAVGLLDLRARDVVAATWSVTNWHAIDEARTGALAAVLGPLGPTWSLAVEEQAYLAMALVAWVGVRLHRPRLALTVAASGAIAVAVAVAMLDHTNGVRVEFGTDARAAEIAAGVLLAVGLTRWPDVLDRHRAALTVVGPLALVALLVLYMVGDYSPPWLLNGGFLAVALLSVIIVATGLVPTPLTRALSDRRLVAIGRASYSLYLVHWPVFLMVTADRIGRAGSALLVTRLALAALAAAVLHLSIEQPCRRRHITPPRALALWLVSSGVLTVGALALL